MIQCYNARARQRFAIAAAMGLAMAVPAAAEAALAIDASSPARVTGQPGNYSGSCPNANCLATASFTPPANSLLLVMISADTSSASDITVSVTDSQGLAWTNRVERDPGDGGAQDGHVSIWSAVATASAAMTVYTRRTAGSGSTNRVSVKVYVVTGSRTTSPIGATGEGSSSTNNVTPTAYTSTTKDSRGFGAGTDWLALGAGVTAPTSTDVADAATYSDDIDAISLYKASDTATAGTEVTLNLDAAGTGTPAWNWAAVEVISAATVKLQSGTRLRGGATMRTGP